MQKLRDLAAQVEQVYVDMAKTFIDYQNRRQLHCRNGCGKCCLHPGIHASVLEMLPLALHLYDTGQAENVLDQLENHTGDLCIFYRPTSPEKLQGYCGIYNQRGSICRMFGAAGYPDKHGKAGLATCQIIREDNAEAYAATLVAIDSDPPPMMKHWKSQVGSIDYATGNEEMPLNDAVRSALVRVLMHAQFTGRSD